MHRVPADISSNGAAEARIRTANEGNAPNNADEAEDSPTEDEDNADPLSPVPKSAPQPAIKSYGISEYNFSGTIMNPQCYDLFGESRPRRYDR